MLKTLKCIGYTNVIISEFDLMRFVLGLGIDHPRVREWKRRTKALGSAISTSRMTLRLFMFIDSIKYLCVTYGKYVQGCKLLLALIIVGSVDRAEEETRQDCD